jgi:hypothetical protein
MVPAFSPLSLSALWFDLAAPPAAGDTIHVTDSYTVDAGDTLELSGSPGFKLEPKSGASVSLDIEGVVNLEGGAHRDKMVGVYTTQSINGGADVHIGAAGILSVVMHSDGQAAGVAMLTDGGTVENEGQIRVLSGGGFGAFGVGLASHRSSFTNSGEVHVSSDGQLTIGVAAALEGEQDVDVTNTGLVEVHGGQTAYGMVSQGAGGTIDNQDLIVVEGAFAYGMASAGTSTAANHGSIRARGLGPGGGAAGVAVSASTGLVNSGDIHAFGADGAVGVWMLGGGVIDNTGWIHASGAGLSAGIYNATNSATTVVNHGLIRGQYAILSQDALDGFATVSDDTVTNYGKLAGDVVLGGGSDSVTNFGRILGDIDLGDGDDTLVSSLGKIQGAVVGGLGDDHITGSRGADTLYGDRIDGSGGGGDDDLRGANGADSLFGGEGGDTLTGGAGADTLSGGLGDDTFRFAKLTDSAATGADLISDLGASDVIDLHLIDADIFTGGDQTFHQVGSFSGAAGELTVTYDAGSDLTTIAGDMDGDGDADLVITAAGDQHAYSGFVL